MSFKFGQKKWRMPKEKAETGYESRQSGRISARHERVSTTYEKKSWRKLAKIKFKKILPPFKKANVKGTATSARPSTMSDEEVDRHVLSILDGGKQASTESTHVEGAEHTATKSTLVEPISDAGAGAAMVERLGL
tara:strand:+ start:478 stop:882 length:405 start_codon:yes stop_codon:yes gene_type:complete